MTGDVVNPKESRVPPQIAAKDREQPTGDGEGESLAGHSPSAPDEIVLHPETVAQRVARINKRWGEGLAQKGGYWLDIRVGGGPTTFTAWTPEREGLVPFAQATGGTPQEAIANLVEGLDLDGAFDSMLAVMLR